MESTYAEALWQTVARGTDAKKAVHALRETLVADGREALLPRIARAFGRLAEREAKRSDVVLTVAREKDERTAHKEIKQLLSEMKVDAKEVTTRVDDTLIGGWRLEGRENLADASFKKYLLGMYNAVTNGVSTRI